MIVELSRLGSTDVDDRYMGQMPLMIDWWSYEGFLTEILQGGPRAQSLYMCSSVINTTSTHIGHFKAPVISVFMSFSRSVIKNSS